MSEERAGFRKGRGTSDQIANMRWIIVKTIEYGKISIFVLHGLQQSFGLCRSQSTVEHVEKLGGARAHDNPHKEPVHE